MWYSPLSELRENLSRLGANLKQSLLESARKTWESINEFARAHSSQGSGVKDAAVEEATDVKGNHSNCRGFFKGAASPRGSVCNRGKNKTSVKHLKCYSCSVKRTVLYNWNETIYFVFRREKGKKRKKTIKSQKDSERWQIAFSLIHLKTWYCTGRFWKKKKVFASTFFPQWHSAYF